MYKYLYLLLSLIFLYSCQADTPLINQVSLLESTEIKFPLGSTVPPKSATTKEKDGLLFYLNKNNNTILIYDILKKEKISTLEFQKEGDQGVGKITGFTLLNNGNLLLSSSGKPYLYEVNNKGELIGKKTYDTAVSNSQVGTYAPLTSRMSNDVYEFDDKYLIPQHLYSQGDFEKFKNLAPFSLFIEYDKKTAAANFVEFYFPKKYFSNGYLSPIQSNTSNGNVIVSSFRGDPNIYTYDLKTKITNSHLAKSNIADDIKPIPFDQIQMIHRTEVTNYHVHYESIDYDPYHKVYYRICRLVSKDLDKVKKDSDHYYSYPDRISIIILDHEFNIIGEKELDGDLYYMYNTFITEEGLYISCSNPLNPNFNEDELTFKLLKLIDIDTQ